MYKFYIAVIIAVFILFFALYVSKPNTAINNNISKSISITPTVNLTATLEATLNQQENTLTQSAFNPNAKCHINGVLPDPSCTPGAIDPRVTQANIQQTICVFGYTKTVRPSVSYTNELKIQSIAMYGYEDTNPRDYEEDHLISLELGGSPTDPKNLWAEPGASPNPKDRIENLCHKKVCDGEISLENAQQEIATNWQTACQ